MHRCFTVIAFILVASGCGRRSGAEKATKSDELPTMTLHVDSDEKAMLIATVSNPLSSELSIPGFRGEVIYGSYWYQDDKVVNVPECGTDFWDSVIKIPAGQTRELRLPVPRALSRGERYTVAVVYAGLGSSTGGQVGKNVSAEEFIRHPDVSLKCRKMEAEVKLATE